MNSLASLDPKIKILASTESEININPIFDLEWMWRALTDQSLYYATRINATRTLLRSLDYVIRTNGYLTAFIYGHPNTGKSEVADSIAFAFKNRLEKAGQKGHLEATFNFGETLERILYHQEEKTKNVIFLQDEIPKLHGKGSRIARDAIENILMTTRAWKWSYIFSSPVHVDLPGIQFLIETTFMDWGKRINRGILFTSTKRPIGHVNIPLINDDAWHDAKDKRKMQNIEEILSSGGYQSISAKLQNHLSQQKNKSIEPNNTTYTGELTDNLQKMTINHLETYEVTERNRSIFTDYCQGNTQREISKEYKLEQPTISEIIKKIKQKYLGYAFEDIYFQIKQEENEYWVQGGKNSPDPDLINFELKQVLSVKCYCDHRNIVTIPSKEIAKSELAFLKEDYQLKLIFYNIYWDQLFIQELNGNEERFSFKIRQKSRVTK